MLGDYLTALLVAVLGYVYPVYLCFKVRATRSPRPGQNDAFSHRVRSLRRRTPRNVARVTPLALALASRRPRRDAR